MSPNIAYNRGEFGEIAAHCRRLHVALGPGPNFKKFDHIANGRGVKGGEFVEDSLRYHLFS